MTAQSMAQGGTHYAFYGDDFTGATDTLAHLARAGLRTVLFLAPPDASRLAALGPLDAIGVAGAARSMAPAAMRAELREVAECFTALKVRVMHYKVCSTFDSAPQVGSIGVALRTLAERFANPLRMIVGGQPNLRRYCVFGELYAAAGAGDDAPVYRIDRHPTMSRHPVTPMNEADLTVHLRAQGLHTVRSVDWRCYGANQLSAHVERALAVRPDALLFDVQSDAHLREIGDVMLAHSAHAPLLAIGASSVAQAYAMALNDGAKTSCLSDAAIDAAEGPVFVLAGSLSPATEAQIAAAHSYRTVELDPVAMTDENAPRYLESRIAWIAALLKEHQHVLAFTKRARVEQSASTLASACGELLKGVLANAGLTRVGIAGGDTSSFAVRALDAWALSYRAPLSAGVAICRVHSDDARLDGIDIMLKGGQMGETDLFEQLVKGTRRS